MMYMIIQQIYSPIEVTTILFFGSMVMAAFICLLFRKSEDIMQKVVGGFSVFIIAILANYWVVYLLSIFVGGLIIASEQFMMFIAAILKSDGTKIPETVKAFSVQSATKEEMEKKVKKEVSELEDPLVSDGSREATIFDTNEPRYKLGSSEKMNERTKKIREVTEKVHSLLANKYGSTYRKNVKVKYGDKSAILDAIIQTRKGKVQKVVEIKLVTAKSFSNLKWIVVRFIKKLAKIGLTAPLLFVVVSPDMTLEDAKSLYEDNKGFAEFRFYKLIEPGELEEIDISGEIL